MASSLQLGRIPREMRGLKMPLVIRRHSCIKSHLTGDAWIKGTNPDISTFSGGSRILYGMRGLMMWRVHNRKSIIKSSPNPLL